MNCSQNAQRKNLKRKHKSLNASGDSVVNGTDNTQHNDSNNLEECTPSRPFWSAYCDVYDKLAETASEVQTTEDCIVTTRIVDITSAKLAQDIQKLDLSSIDHWAVISTNLIRDWDKFFCGDGNVGWSIGDLVPLHRYKSNYFGLRNILLRKKGLQEETTESSQKKKKVVRKDDNSRSKVSKPLEGMVNDKPLPLIEHMNRVVTAIKKNLKGGKHHLEYLKLVINPNSFSATVYNIFTMSFLIREGLVSMSIGKDGEPLVSLCSESKLKSKNNNEQGKGHFVIDLTTGQWKSLVERLSIKSAMIVCPEGGSEDDMFYERFTMSQNERSRKKK